MADFQENEKEFVDAILHDCLIIRALVKLFFGFVGFNWENVDGVICGECSS